MATTSMQAPPAVGWHWIARLAAIGAFGFWMMFVIGEGFPPLGKQPLGVQLTFAALGVMFVGYLVGWNVPLAGGLLTLAGFTMLHAVNLYGSGGLAGPWFTVFAVPGVLFLVAAWMRRRGAAAT